MVKSELIHAIAYENDTLPLHDVESSVSALIDYLCEELSKDTRIEIRGFGSFELRYHAPRKARNPRTGESVMMSSKYSPHFKPGLELRQKVK